MEKQSVKLQVFFQEPFWIGICEINSDNKLQVCKVTFGAEPKDYEVQEYILKNWYRLRFSPAIDDTVIAKSQINPKRLQRDVKKQICSIGISTKSQLALSLQHEEGKIKRKVLTKQQKEEEKERFFLLKQQKRKEKHRGR